MVQATGTVEAPAEETLARRNIEVHVAGSVTGQLAVGENIVQVDAKPGAIVNLYQGKPIVPHRRPTPVLLRPRPFSGLIGREAEVAAAKNVIGAAQPFEYFAPAGWGKTVLLRYLGQLSADSYDDGVVYQPLAGQPLDDLLQFCFDAFYQTDAPMPYKPTAGQLRQLLQPLRILLILDDLDLDREHVDALMEWLPNAVVLLATKDRTLWGSGQALSVAGLARDAARQLFEREAGRPLTRAEEPDFDALWLSLQGNPLALIQAAAASREHGQAIASLRADDATGPGAPVIGQLLGSLSADERKVLGVLAAVHDAAVPAAHVAAITGLAVAPLLLDRLTHQGLTETEDGGYRLSKEPADAMLRIANPQEWVDRTVTHFAAWAERFADEPRLILEVADLLLKMVELGTDTRRWKEVWRLVRAVDRSLALAGRWAAWQRVLNLGLGAANQLADRAAEAWLLHQLGTRALCLGETAAAGTLLQQALEIRQAIGDSEGIAVTSHNLQRLGPTPPMPPPPSPPAPAPRVRWLRWLLRVGASLAVAVIAGFLLPQPGAGSFLGPLVFRSGVVSLEASQPLNFGAVAVGRVSGTRTLTLHNAGNSALRLTGVSAGAPFQQTNNCPVELNANQTCAIVLTFNPSSSGQQSGVVAVTADGKDYTAALSGKGIFTWQLKQLPIDFGKVTVGVAQRKELRLINTSGAPLQLGSIVTRSVTKSFSVAAQGCLSPTPIAPEASCPIVVRFVPELAGALTDSLLIADTADDQQLYGLTGQGVLPQVMLSQTSVDWTKDPNTPNPVQITVTNTGEGVLLISSVRLTDDSSRFFTIASDECSNGSLKPQATCAVEVGHMAALRALANNLNGVLQFTDNASDSPQSVRLHAVG